jgi:hypothetical protein
MATTTASLLSPMHLPSQDSRGGIRQLSSTQYGEQRLLFETVKEATLVSPGDHRKRDKPPDAEHRELEAHYQPPEQEGNRDEEARRGIAVLCSTHMSRIHA